MGSPIRFELGKYFSSVVHVKSPKIVFIEMGYAQFKPEKHS